MSVTIVCALIAVVLQLIVAPAITIAGVVPNFIMVAAVILAMHHAPVRSMLTGFFLGFIYDLCSLGPMGAMTLVLTILSFIVSSINKDAIGGGVLVEIFVLFAVVTLGELLTSVIYSVAGVNPEFLLSLIYRVLPAIVINTVIGCILTLIYNAVLMSKSTNTPLGMGAGRKKGRSISRKIYK
ncbi:MAG: rod shape-determining protein MreD [Coriobacteriia bacterium]|nr:rod shape-determining protein MreD [Coriobacteriia bacterium]